MSVDTTKQQFLNLEYTDAYDDKKSRRSISEAERPKESNYLNTDNLLDNSKCAAHSV